MVKLSNLCVVGTKEKLLQIVKRNLVFQEKN